MFESLSERLGKTFDKLRGRQLTEKNIEDTVRDIRVSLLDADVALPVVKDFIHHIKEKAIGQKVITSLDPGKTLIKIVNDELIDIMGKIWVPLEFKTQPPAIILMAGLQGSGKTTTVAKLARYLKEREKKKVLVCSADIYRPAAIEQLQKLAEEIEVDFFPSSISQKPSDIALAAMDRARKQLSDVLIIDTAGRLHIDNEMMDEIKTLHQVSNPIETLLVVDSMTGQDAAHIAKSFNEVLPLTGIILTKTDGDARGGAALSIRHITGKPIKFYGVGEKTDALEPFHPERVVSRLLGMGDILSLIEDAQLKIDKEQAIKASKKMRKGTFDFNDFKDQMQQVGKMGGMSSFLSKMPGLGNLTKMANEKLNDKSVDRTIAIINSMTKQERRFPDLISGSRKRRIALGSGTDIQKVNQLLKQFKQMQKMMKKLSKPDAMKKMMRGLQGMLPPSITGGFN